MRKWENAELEELSISQTQYGGKTVTRFDSIYINSDGMFEGTFESDESTPPSLLS